MTASAVFYFARGRGGSYLSCCREGHFHARPELEVTADTSVHRPDERDGQVNGQAADETKKSATVEADATASVAFSVKCETVEFPYDAGPGVPTHDRVLIEEGMAIGQVYLEQKLGGDIRPGVRATMTVRIVATGEGNQELGGGGACCTASAHP